MEWSTFAVIAAIFSLLCLFQYETGAGDKVNRGRIGCMMPKSMNLAKGNRLKDNRA